MTYGLIQGLYSSENYPTDTGCLHCRAIAVPVANLHHSIVNIYQKKDALLEDLTGDKTLDQLSAIFTVY